MLEEMTKKYSQALDSLGADEINKISEIISNRYGNKGRIFICGNGGSASIASHFASDLVKYTEPKKEFCVISLADNISLMTAISNDISYDEIFSEQLKIHGTNEHDILIAISSKGKSENILRAVRYANEKGSITIGLTGSTGGVLKDIAKHCIAVDSEDYTIIEPVHSFICHVIAESLKRDFQNKG